mmetsp:Transcript_3570/g.6134  ORF Transcript_3570/g.6134 Transcript_3570/m.6134 type:complete len:216 (+) Transcript_3570:473-1120(+)
MWSAIRKPVLQRLLQASENRLILPPHGRKGLGDQHSVSQIHDLLGARRSRGQRVVQLRWGMVPLQAFRIGEREGPGQFGDVLEEELGGGQWVSQQKQRSFLRRRHQVGIERLARRQGLQRASQRLRLARVGFVGQCDRRGVVQLGKHESDFCAGAKERRDLGGCGGIEANESAGAEREKEVFVFDLELRVGPRDLRELLGCGFVQSSLDEPTRHR